MSAATLSQVNLVVSDMDATLAFYRALGLDFGDHAGRVWPAGTGARHAETVTPGGVRLEFDTVEMAGLWHAGWHVQDRVTPTSAVVIGFDVPSREEVDRLHTQLTTAGHTSCVDPYDAFWGGRYAVVADPDGHQCGLMGPTSRGAGSRRGRR